MLWNRRPDVPDVFTGPLLRCSFCNKSQRDVPKMVAGPRVSICSECVEICQDVFAEDRVLSAPDPEAVQRGEDLVSGKDAMRCALCSAIRPLHHCVQVASRGWLCRPCVIAAAKALEEQP
jgi:ATP-dependent protease Clp ATPase subunit